MPILGDMELVIIAFLLLIGPLAVAFGVDSNKYDGRDLDRRGWWPATRA